MSDDPMTSENAPPAPGPGHPGSRRDATAAAAAAAEPVVTSQTELEPEPYAVVTREDAAEFGNYVTYIFAGTELPFRAFPRDRDRARGYVIVSGTGPAYVSRSKDAIMQARSVTPGTSAVVSGVAILATGQTLPVTHQEPLYVAPDGTHAVTVVVAVEKWSANPAS